MLYSLLLQYFRYCVGRTNPGSFMWIVKNVQKTALRLEDLALEIPPGDFLDLDALGRSVTQASKDLLKAIAAGHLEVVAKSADESRRLLEPQRGSDLFNELENKLKAGKDAIVRELVGSAEIDTSRIDALLTTFNDSAIEELKNTVARAGRLQQPSAPAAVEAEDDAETKELAEESPEMKTEFDAFRRLLEEFEMLKELLRDEVQGLVSEVRKAKAVVPEPEPEPVPTPRKRPKLTEADFRARAAIIDDIEREIHKNFQKIGSQVKKQKDRTGLVDKLKGL